MIVFRLIFIIFCLKSAFSLADICNRTKIIQNAIIKRLGKSNCLEIKDQDLRLIKSLDLNHFGSIKVINLKNDDFAGLSALEKLDLGVYDLYPYCFKFPVKKCWPFVSAVLDFPYGKVFNSKTT